MRALSLLSVTAVVVLSVSLSAQRAARPNLSGYWGAGRAFKAAEKDPRPLPPNTVLLTDAGAPELAIGNFGGLKVKPAALAAAQKWKPADEMTLAKACQPPSLVYTMQGPFPMEVDQATELIVMRLEYYDLVRVIYLDGRSHPPFVGNGISDRQRTSASSHFEQT